MTLADRIFSFSRAHDEAVARGMGHDEALGFALAAEMASREPDVSAGSILAGMPRSVSLVRLNISGLTCAGEVPEALLGTPDEDEARRTIDAWQPRTTGALFAKARGIEFTPEELDTICEPSLGWGGGWGGHAILGYDRVLREGVGGLREYVREHLRRAEPEGLDWYRGLLHVCDGIAAFIRAHADRAAELAQAAESDAEREHFAAIERTCRHVAIGGARDLREAVQLFWFVHVLDDTDSPGRIDQFLLPYYLTLPEQPDRRAAAYPILEALWRKFVACRSWNVCLAGQTAAGMDAANDLTYLFLDLQGLINREAPNLSVRLFAGSPPDLLQRCAEVIGKGSGMPALYNDEVLVPALASLGIPVEHARDYAMNGCMQIDIQGRSHMGLEDGEMNLAKCLELALHAGRSPISGKRAGAPTLPLDQIRDFETLVRQVERQIEHGAGMLTRSANVFQRVIAESGPHLLRSLFIEPCVERGKDMKRGGALYNHGQFLTQGIANAGDALLAIRTLVFEEKRCTLPELVAILDANWEGEEALRAYVLEKLPKFGNDREEVDALASRLTEHYFAHLRTLRTWRGGRYSGGVIVFVRAPEFGRGLAASADGRERGEPVADSCGPMRGRDRRGPTAMLKSAARLPNHLAGSAVCLNLKLSPSLFAEGDAGSKRAADLVRGFFALGGQQVQVNVVDAATLRAAKANPDAYRSLVVRVGGFSGLFVNLAPAIQDDIIARTEHM